MSSEKQQSGRPGGLATLEKYGRQHYSDIGKLGGRPRRLGISALRQQSASEEITAEEAVPLRRLPLTKLRKLYLQHQRSSLETVHTTGPAGQVPKAH